MEINKLYKKDCLEYMKTLPDKSVDLIISDPPYFQIVPKISMWYFNTAFAK